jgi:amino-acid N-acetyltransferase
MSVALLTEQDLPEILQLLERSRLPTGDLAQAKPVFMGVRETALVGVVGVEPLGRFGLLRSLAVTEDARGRGLGSDLAQAAEQWAAEQGIEELYLLTTTAERFFARRTYAVQPREQVPEAIRGTTEFSSACPASATVMHRAVRQSPLQEDEPV